MRLQAGQPAPDFLRPDIGGKTIRLGDYRGRYLLLSFYRYASCPFCNLRVHELLQRSITLVPADFLIGPDGRILVAYYGKDISDHLPIEIILQQLDVRRAA